ncbi:MmyB family transcriptional regulator [Paenibacillus sp. TY11]|uniref:MmyB family transcriptional regulator n=1 Tax=Paenibacillus sp. TY11 TaxID=3448633 RepID=UPI004039DB70
MSNDYSKSKTLGAFLKSRRNRLQPEQAGLRLSQVQLTYDERAHLIQLWDPNETNAVSCIHTTLNPQGQNIIDQLSYPSFISNERAEVLAWNSAANEVITDFSSLSASERVMIRLLFVDPELRSRMVNWEEFASYSVAVFRTYYDKYLGDPWFEETVERLRVESMEFDTMWKLHQIQLKKVNRVSFQISDAVEAVSYDINSLASIADHPGLHICIYTPVLEEKT